MQVTTNSTRRNEEQNLLINGDFGRDQTDQYKIPTSMEELNVKRERIEL